MGFPFDSAPRLWQCAPPDWRSRIGGRIRGNRTGGWKQDRTVSAGQETKERLVYKPEWGTKHQCPKCSARFYDLGVDNPVHCIGCGFDWTPEPILKSKQPLAFESAKPESQAVEADAEAELDVDDELDDVAEESVGDVSLDDDDADLSEVVDSSRADE